MTDFARLLMLAAIVLSIAVASSPSTARAQGLWGAIRTPYALDGIQRREQDRSVCDASAMVVHRGERVRLATPVRVHPAFLERIRRFEEVVATVALEIYGRIPHRIEHQGGYACRTVRGRRSRISEHALGNALDVGAFRFRGLGRLPAPDGLPRHLRRGFTVRVRSHWEPRRERDATHSVFLHRLVDELVHQDVFRVIYGPAHRGHRGHFHFDMSPFRWIHV